MSDELTQVSASRLAGMLRDRTVSPVEVAEAYLRRIQQLNPEVNAVVSIASNVIDCAREAEATIMRNNNVGKLCGVPLTVKDTIDVRGLRSTAGSRIRQGHVPRGDAGAVARLRGAGAIILGKTNTSEMALEYSADNPVFGRTNNPYDASRTPGGSSGGCAAAVAAGLSSGSLGSDLVGSIRIPAHFCGVVGFKPTTGRVPSSGHYPPAAGAYSLAASLGPIAQSVEDAMLLYGVLSHRERVIDEGALESHQASLLGVGLAYFTSDAAAPASPEIIRAVERAAAAMRDAGMNVKEERPPGFESATDLWLRLCSRETQRIVCSAYKGREDEAGHAAKLIIDSAAASVPQTLDDFHNAWCERDKARSMLLDWMETTPLVVAPVGAITAFGHDANRRFTAEGKRFGLFRAFGYAQAANVFDLPAISVPVGRTREGLPIGVQVIGRPLEEWQVLAAAHVLESAVGS
jgi:amidase